MKLPAEEIIQILLDRDYIEQSDIDGFTHSGETDQIEYLINKDILNRTLIGQALAEHFSLPYINLELLSPPKSTVLKIPKEIAEQYRIVLAGYHNGNAVLATDDPEKAKKTPLKLDFLEGRGVELRYATSEHFEQAFNHYGEEIGEKLENIISVESLSAPQIFETLIREALKLKASDIHFDPEQENITIRYRIDGQLFDQTTLKKDKYESVLNKIKIESKLRIDHHDEALDGAVRFSSKDIDVDLRVSIIPTINGEKVAIRILKRYVENLSFESLGLSEKNASLLNDAIQQPNGMIIVTGPTGSGKTTTLYTLLKKLNQRSVNITTIEDPVEYRVEGINQIQVNNDTGLTFAKGLRSIVRQDPDIILVGEIRDNETAEIAINSALTGHLLLTSFHANSASATIPRLIDMGIEPFLLASTIELIISQRLVRKLCTSCRFSSTVARTAFIEQFDSASTINTDFGDKQEVTVYFAKGCDSCNQTGYKGRIGIYEFIEMTKETRELISKSPTADQVESLARKNGSQTILSDGLEKVLLGETTVDEIKRVTGRK